MSALLGKKNMIRCTIRCSSREKLKTANESALPMEPVAVLKCPSNGSCCRYKVPSFPNRWSFQWSIWYCIRYSNRSEKKMSRKQYCTVDGICARLRMLGRFPNGCPFREDNGMCYPSNGINLKV